MSDEQERFDAVTSNEPVQQEAPVAETIAAPEPTADVNRDEAGRFAASKGDATETQTEGDAKAAPEAKEPPEFRFREVSEARRKAELEAAELRAELRLMKEMRQSSNGPAAKQEEPVTPEFWDDPVAAMQHRVAPVMTELQQTREMYSLRFAEQAHGKEKVAEAYKALDTAIKSGQVDGNAVLGQLRASMDPYGDIMTWHDRHSVIAEIGTDRKAFEQKIIDRALSDPAVLARALEAAKGQSATQQAGSVVRLPPSLTRATSAASNTAGASDASMNDEDRFASVTSRRR